MPQFQKIYLTFLILLAVAIVGLGSFLAVGYFVGDGTDVAEKAEVFEDVELDTDEIEDRDYVENLYFIANSAERGDQSIWQLNTATGEIEEVFVMDKSTSKIAGLYEEGKYIAWSNIDEKTGVGYMLDVEGKEIRKLFELEEGFIILDAKISHNKEKVAYIVYKWNGMLPAERKVMIYDINSKEHTKITDDIEFNLFYSTANILGWGSGDESLIIRERWGSIGRAQISVKVYDVLSGATVKEYADRKDWEEFEEHVPYDAYLEPRFITGVISPSGTYLLYYDCGAEFFIPGPPYTACSEDQRLHVYDLASEEDVIIYTNVPIEGFSTTRQVLSYEWYGQDKVIFVNFEGVFLADLESGDAEKVYELQIETEDAIREKIPTIVRTYREDPFVVLATDRFIDGRRMTGYSYHILNIEDRTMFRDVGALHEIHRMKFLGD